MIDRREALRRTSYLLGGAALSASTVVAVMSGCKPRTIALDWDPQFMNVDQARAVAEIAERIIPNTDTPGAKAAMVDRFIDVFLKDIASEEEQKAFNAGMADIDKRCRAAHGKPFADLSDVDRDALLTEISSTGPGEVSDEEAAAEMANEGEQVQSGTSAKEFFGKLRQLVVAGYFTSEIGAKQALKFDAIPGEYNGCVSYDQIGGTWAL